MANPPLLQSTDFTSYLNEKCMQLAPGDVKTVLAQAAAIRRRAKSLGERHLRMQRQVDFALTLLEEHFKGRCPQIPYYTIATLAVALLYFSDPVDVIPDWIPGVGIADDAIVFELAFGMARAGIDRYCAWKSLPMDDFYPPARSAVKKSAPPRRAASAQTSKRRAAARKTPRRR
jgi:uncharacterized membrane protein YkvA (DUF1232 family)